MSSVHHFHGYPMTWSVFYFIKHRIYEVELQIYVYNSIHIFTNVKQSTPLSTGFFDSVK